MNKYVNEINGNKKKYKLLSKDEEYNLLKKAQRGDSRAFNTLVECNQHNVIKLVHKFFVKDVNDYDDLYQEANVSLIKAIYKFNIKSENRFISYATQVINHDLIKYINKQAHIIKVPVYMHTKFNQISKINESFVDIEKAYKENEITNYMIKAYNSYNHIYSMENANYIPATQDEIQKDYLDELLPILNADELKVITMWYGLDDSNKKTYKEIGKNMGYSKMTIYTLKKKSLEKMTKHLKEILKQDL